MSPISVAGVLKMMYGTGELLGDIGKTIIPGGETWDDDTTKHMINTLRMIPFLGESVVRNILHNTIRSGRGRGALQKFGSNKQYGLFGLDDHAYDMDPRYIAESLLRETNPDQFPDDITKLPYEEYIAIRQNIHDLPDIPTQEEAVAQPQVMPQAAPVEQPETGEYLAAPELPKQPYLRSPDKL